MKFTREQIAKALKLYVITDRSWLKEDETLLSVCEKVIQNGATFLQLREKELGAEETRKEAIELQKLCHRYNIPFVVNDSVEIALEMDADGVHVGQSDIKERDIRAMIGPDKILGMTAKTVEQAIAAEKAGIIKEGVPVVIGRARGAVKKVFSAKAEEMNAPITYTKQTAASNDVAIYSYPELQKERNNFYEMTRQGLEMFKMLQDKHRKNEKSLEKLLSTFNLDNALRAMDRILDKRKSAIKLSNNHFQDGIFLELTGLYQVENGFTILTALDELVKMGYHISPKNYFEGFSNVCELTGLMGRWQKVYSYPDIICDTGHNVDGIKYICKQLEAIRANDGKKIHIVFGMVNDKDISGVLKILPKDATYYFTKASVKRALPENELQELAQKAGLKGNAYPTVVEAVQAAKKDCPPKDFIFVGGSSFIVADLLANRDTLDLY